MIETSNQLITVTDNNDHLRRAAQAMVEAYQPHVMDERCRVCNLAWQNLREALAAETEAK